jgi:flagellar hook assembly protein FlgD
VEEDQETQVIPGFSLKQNYPNPFNPITTVTFKVQGSKFKVPLPTTLKIYNILGQKVRTLVDEPKRAGNYEVVWDGKDDNGKEVASGIYFYQLKAGDFTEAKKMLLLK